MEKVGCCLQEALGREANVADKVEKLEHHMQTKRWKMFSVVSEFPLLVNVQGKLVEKLCKLVGWGLVKWHFSCSLAKIVFAYCVNLSPSWQKITWKRISCTWGSFLEHGIFFVSALTLLVQKGSVNGHFGNTYVVIGIYFMALFHLKGKFDLMRVTWGLDSVVIVTTAEAIFRPIMLDGFSVTHSASRYD